MRIIGVDCSTSETGVAVAVATLELGHLAISPPLQCGGTAGAVLEVLSSQIDREEACLLALDAPLGWPTALGPALSGHQAGRPVAVDANLLFRRATDRYIKLRTNQQPLDVGADRIARTAHWAVNLLAKLREKLDEEIPLAWSPSEVRGVAAIEVYPAASLRVRGISAVGYKKREQAPARLSIARALASEATLPTDLSALTVNADALDSAICAIAGADFMQGFCMEPCDDTEARREGWIWVRDPSRQNGVA